ncbi:MAG: hypothetical protein B5M53_11080 [Candidatus Cloacimonas sp. 4484_209]|nr:MAG: hypothetical protein B5M53_11080 [Candidatus Cloacimonas sp. 4484_209]
MPWQSQFFVQGTSDLRSRKLSEDNECYGVILYNSSVPDEVNRVIFQRLITLGSEFPIILLTESQFTYPEEIKEKVMIRKLPLDFSRIPFIGKLLSKMLFKVWALYNILFIKYGKKTFVYTFAFPPNHTIGFLASMFKHYTWILEIMHSPYYYLDFGKVKRSYLLILRGLLCVAISKIMIKRANLILATSHTVKDGCAKILKDDFGVPEEKIFPIQQGVSTKNMYRTVNNDTSKYFQIVYVGSISERKCNELFDSIDKLEKVVPKLRVLLIGPVSKSFGKEFNQILKQNPTILNYLGKLSHKEALDYIRKADLCVCTIDSRIRDYNFAQPVKVLEYLAMGKPVVTTNLEGIRGIITHGYNGLLYEPGNVDSFVSAVLEVASNHLLRKNESLFIRYHCNINVCYTHYWH